MESVGEWKSFAPLVTSRPRVVDLVDGAADAGDGTGMLISSRRRRAYCPAAWSQHFSPTSYSSSEGDGHPVVGELVTVPEISSVLPTCLVAHLRFLPPRRHKFHPQPSSREDRQMPLVRMRWRMSSSSSARWFSVPAAGA
jgi:hypothetical protein